MEFLPLTVREAMSSNRPIDDKFDEIRSNQSMITEKHNVEKKSTSNKNNFYYFHSKKYSTGNTGNIPHTEASKDSYPTSCTLISDTIILLQVSTKSIQIKPPSQNDQNMPVRSASKDNPSDAANHQIQSQNTAAFPFIKI